jgi:predicted transcriptional regulator
VSVLDEEIDKGLADFRTGRFFRGHSISEYVSTNYTKRHEVCL